jgi:hypothetical protein
MNIQNNVVLLQKAVENEGMILKKSLSRKFRIPSEQWHMKVVSSNVKGACSYRMYCGKLC